MKNPYQNFTRLKPAKTALFDWMAPWKFLIFIIHFSWGKTNQLSGALCYLQWWNLVKFNPLDSTHFGIFCWFPLGFVRKLISITYVIMMLFWKKISKTLKNYSFRTLFGQKLGQHGPHPKSNLILFLELTKGDHKLPRTFYFIKIS